MANVAVAEPAAIVTLVGTVAAALSLASVTTTPAVGAGPLNVTVPVAGEPPTSDDGEMLNAVRTGGLIASGTDADAPFAAAEIVAEIADVTALVVTLNVAEFAPAATVIVAGTLAALLLLETVTETPAAGAGPESVTVAETFVPPVAVAGVRLIESGTAAATASVPLLVVACTEAVIVAVVDATTGEVEIGNELEVEPAGTTMLAGTDAAGLSEESVTFAPGASAGPLSEMVPLADVPPVTAGGMRTSGPGTAAVMVRTPLAAAPFAAAEIVAAAV